MLSFLTEFQSFQWQGFFSFFSYFKQNEQHVIYEFRIRNQSVDECTESSEFLFPCRVTNFHLSETQSTLSNSSSFVVLIINELDWRGRHDVVLSFIDKLLREIIIGRVNSTASETIRHEQAGFRRNRICVNLIFSLRNRSEQRQKNGRDRYNKL